LFISIAIDGRYEPEAFALTGLSEPLVHLYICLIYLRVSTEVTYLLDKNIYLENQSTLADFDRKKRNLLVFFFINVVLCVGLGLLTLIAYTRASLGLLSFISDWLFIIFQFAYFLIWAWALYALYRDIKHANMLLPNKRIFVLHGSLLILYILGVTGDTVLSYMPQWLGCGEICFDKWRSFGQISVTVGNYAESASFLLVIYVMNPFTRKQRQQQQSFREFMTNGLVDFDKIEPAVLAANPNLTPFEKEVLVESLERFQMFMTESVDSQ
jgi:hypothetical protein